VAPFGGNWAISVSGNWRYKGCRALRRDPPTWRVRDRTFARRSTFVLHMIAKQIPYRYPNIKFMNDRLRPFPDIRPGPSHKLEL